MHQKPFRKGVVLAVSSPTAILWFATVGGVLISRLGHQGTWVVVWFLAGFFVAGLAPVAAGFAVVVAGLAPVVAGFLYLDCAIAPIATTKAAVINNPE